MLLSEEVADSWREIEEQKADLETQLRETEQELQNLIRRPAELEPKIAQNQLDKAQVCALALEKKYFCLFILQLYHCYERNIHLRLILDPLWSCLQEFLQQIRERQSEAAHLNEVISRLTNGQVSPALEEIRRLKRGWIVLGQRAEELEAQRGEDMQRSGEFQESVVAVEELFHQVSREWDYLARYQAILGGFDV